MTLRVASGCDVGVATTLKPAKCATVVGRVDGTNGAPVAVAIRVARPGCSFHVMADERVVARIASNVGVKSQSG